MTVTEPGDEEQTPPQSETFPSRRMLAGITVTALALLATVIGVGLVRDDLDPTGVAVVLSTLISGIVIGTRGKGTG